MITVPAPLIQYLFALCLRVLGYVRAANSRLAAFWQGRIASSAMKKPLRKWTTRDRAAVAASALRAWQAFHAYGLILCAALLLVGQGSAQATPKWVRRATLVAACAASATDAATTWRDGLRESNPLLRAANGGPSMPRVIGLKAGFCAASAWSQERGAHNTLYSFTNLGTAGLFGWAAWHNANSR